MMALKRYRSWPITLRVPLLVVLLMVGISTVLSQQVLTRLSETQSENLRALTGAYLDGLSTAVQPNVLREDIWEIFDNLDRAKHRYAGLDVLYSIVAKPDGTILASSDPRSFPTQAQVPDDLADGLRDRQLDLDLDANRAFVRRTLVYQGLEIGAIYAGIDVSGLLAERREVLWTLIATNGGLALVFAAIGYVAVRRMVRPIEVLGEQVERLRAGDYRRIPDESLGDPGSEFGRLFRRFNAMAESLREKEALATRLAEEEKLASLGRLTSGIAHEINNPLGGMLNAVDTLRKHGAEPGIRERALDLLQRGLQDIRDVVRSALVTYKGGSDPERLSRRELDDLQYLIKQDVARRRLRLEWRNAIPDVIPVHGGAVRQATLNLLLNACAAAPLEGAVGLCAALNGGALEIAVTDSGPGLPESVRRAYREDATARTLGGDGRGLGVWMVKRLVAGLGGRIDVETGGGRGTLIRLRIPLRSEQGVGNVA